jgi:hypothetical protein
MTTRRRFIFGTFVLGCAVALGVKPKADLIRFNETDYLKVRAFDIASGPDRTTYMMFENGRLIASGNRIEDILSDSTKNS